MFSGDAPVPWMWRTMCNTFAVAIRDNDPAVSSSSERPVTKYIWYLLSQGTLVECLEGAVGQPEDILVGFHAIRLTPRDELGTMAKIVLDGKNAY